MSVQRIALISEHASPLAPSGGVDSGGQNVYVANLARQLARRGHRVDVFTRRDRSFLPTVLRWERNLRIVHVPAGPARFVPKEELLPLMPAFAEFMQRFCAAQDPYDVLHANFFMSGLAAQPLAKCGIPLVVTFHALGRVRREHQGGHDDFPDARFAIEDQLVRSAARIVAECPQDHDDLLRLYGADPQRIEVVPCGFDPDELAPVDQAAARARLGWDPAEFTVLQLGRLVPRKGVDTVIRALALLRDRHGVTARLYVVGGNSYRPNEAATPEIGRLRGIAQDCGVAGQVSFVGRRRREALSQYYSAADVFVTTPWYEPFGITPLEAMACGRPVVGARVGGVAYTVQDGGTGFLVPPRDPAALAARLAELHAQPALRARFGEAGRRRVLRRFTWARVAAQIEQVYGRCLGREARRAVQGGS